MPLVVIEGVDGVGKATQSKLLVSHLRATGHRTTELDFPRYRHGSSVFVREYLAGHFGSDPMTLNPYLISPMYAIDRVVSYLDGWRSKYLAGEWLISDRYTTSNMIHQGSKLPREKRSEFFSWLERTEYDELGLPRPQLVILLDLPSELSAALRLKRGELDIHESDDRYLDVCRETALEASEIFGWSVIDCSGSNGVLTPEKIHSEVIAELRRRTGETSI